MARFKRREDGKEVYWRGAARVKRAVVGIIAVVALAAMGLLTATSASASSGAYGGPPAGDDDQLPVAAPASSQRSVGVNCQTEVTEAMRQYRGADLAKRGSRYFSCVSQGGVSSKASGQLRSEAEIQSVTLPQWCLDHAYEGVWGTRITACQISGLTLTVTDLQTAEVLGVAQYEQAHISVLSQYSPNWAHEIQLTELSATGLAVGMSVYAAASCTVGCTLDYTSLPIQSMSSGTAVLTVDALTNLITPDSSLAGNSSISYYFQGGSADPTAPLYWDDLADVRCDNIRSGVGCVNTWATPVAYFSVSGNGADVSNHMINAIVSGLPGYVGSGAPLHYLADPTLVAQNRDTACDPSWPRNGLSCDEYPFASTSEGAYTGGGAGRTFAGCNVPLPTGVTGPTGWSSCMIDPVSNSYQGGVLSAFNTTQRILDGDAFYVGFVA